MKILLGAWLVLGLIGAFFQHRWISARTMKLTGKPKSE
jgi:hypothetical protein